MEYSYFIENIITKKWYWANLDLEAKRKCYCLRCPYCKSKEGPQSGWTDDPLKALQVSNKEGLTAMFESMKKRNPSVFNDCEITEHLFINNQKIMTTEEILKEELDDLILMRQTPNEGYSSDQMDDMIQKKIIEVSNLKYKNWYTDYEEGKKRGSYESGMTDMYNLMVKYIITDEP